VSLQDTLAAIDAATGCQWCQGPLGKSPSADFCSQECQEAWHQSRVKRLTGYREPWQRPWDFPGVGTEAASTQAAAAPAPVVRMQFSVRQFAEALDGMYSAMQRLADSLVRPPFRLPRMTSDLSADRAALRRARWAARTEQQRRACDLRAEMLHEREPQPMVWICPAVGGEWREFGRLAARALTIPQEPVEIGANLGADWPVSLARISNGAVEDQRDATVQAQRMWLPETVWDEARALGDEAIEETPQQRALRLRRERNTGPQRDPHARRGRGQ
jgi:hypothetical protein